jgi:short subunit dehydrogenase
MSGSFRARRQLGSVLRAERRGGYHYATSEYNGGMKDLKNRVALVTEGSRGIGAAVAIALANASADIAVNYRERADAANAVCGEIIGVGRKVIAVQAEVRTQSREAAR